MKKILFLASLAAVAMTSCTSESNEYVGGNNNTPKEIAFSAFATPATRTAATGAQTSFPDQTMYVTAYQAAPTAKDYFGETAFNKGTTYYGASPSKYWPMGVSTLNFLAVTEGPASTTRAWGTGDANYASKVVVTMADNKSTQHDLMYGYARGSVTQASSGASLTFPAKVDMTFYHTLAWVNFKVKAGDETTAGAGIVVKNISLNNGVYTGEYTLTLSNYNSASTALAVDTEHSGWSATSYNSATPEDKWVLTTDGSIAVNSTTAIDVENTSTTDKGILVVPNPTTANASFASITIKYSHNGEDYTYTYAPALADRLLVNSKKYTYTITFTLNEILINPSVEAWDPIDRTVTVP